MPETLIHPPRTILEVWESLPEGTLCQLINDKLVMSPAPITIHQVISGAIYVEIVLHLRKKRMGEVFAAPYDVHLSKQNIVQPDILFIRNENKNKILAKGVFGAPDLIIELLSTSSISIDFEDKKFLYEKYGVQEYFVIEPDSKSVTSFYLVDGEYEEQENSNGKFRSVLLNAEIVF